MDLSENYPAKTKQVFNRAVTRGSGKIKNTVGSEMTAQLKPFRPVMLRQLNKRGYNTRSMSFNDVVPLYYNEFVSNLRNKKSPLVPIDTYEFSNNPVFRFSSSDNLNGDIFTHENRQYFNQVASITDNIIGKFKESKMKYELRGLGNFEDDLYITKEEIEQGKAAQQVELTLESKAAGDKPVKVKQLLLIGLVVIVLYYMFS